MAISPIRNRRRERFTDEPTMHMRATAYAVPSLHAPERREDEPSAPWSMRERKDLWLTKWASIVTLIAAIGTPIASVSWFAGHKDQAIIEIQSQQAAIEQREASLAKRLDEMQKTLDAILLKRDHQ
jgi:hypothetical protein